MYANVYANVVAILAIVLALVAAVLAFIFIVPENREKNLNSFGKFLHKTVNFKFLIIEKILQAFYIISTAFCIIYGFLMIFNFVETYNWYNGSTRVQWMGWPGFLIMIFGPIMIRLVYEGLFMVILLVKNVISINNKLKNENTDSSADDYFSTPAMSDIMKKNSAYTAPSVPAQNVSAPGFDQSAPSLRFCSTCGTPLDGNGRCPNCGT